MACPRGRHRSYIQNTKYYLKKFNVSTDNRYSLCKDDVETILHVFIKCLEILSLWINSACISTVKLQIEFDLIFGKIPLNEGNKVDNFIFLYTKQYIFNRLKKRRSLTWRGYYNTFIFNKCSIKIWQTGKIYFWTLFFFCKHRNVFLIMYKLQAYASVILFWKVNRHSLRMSTSQKRKMQVYERMQEC